MVNLGSSIKTKIGKQINSLLEKPGFKPPKNRKEKIKVLKKVGKAVEKEIVELEEQEEHNEKGPILQKQQQGASDYSIDNTAGIKDIARLLEYVRPMIRELVVKNLKTKLNVIIGMKIINYSNPGDDGEPQIKPHHLSHLAGGI